MTRSSSMDGLTDSPDKNTLFAATPTLRNPLLHLNSTLARHHACVLGAALRTHGTKKTRVKTTPPIPNGQNHRRPPPRAQQQGPRSQRQMLPRLSGPTTHAAHPAASNPTDISRPRAKTLALPNGHAPAPSTPTNSTALSANVDQVLGRPDHYTWATSSSDYIEQTIRGLSRVAQHGAQPEGAFMDVVLNLRGNTYHMDTAVFTQFSSNAGLILAASGRPGFMAKREEKQKFHRYLRINLAHSVLETSGRPGYHAERFIKSSLPRHRPPANSRDACAAAQTTLNSSISKQQLLAVTT